jgi:hypothetical protein
MAVPPRVMLHAEHLVFSHPVSGKVMDLTAPLPKDFKAMISDLRKRLKSKSDQHNADLARDKILNTARAAGRTRGSY